MSGPDPFRHSWNLTPAQAVVLQKQIRARVISLPLPLPIRLIAGVDAAISPAKDKIVAAVVLLQTPAFDPADRPRLQAQDMIILEQAHAWGNLDFPYIPGLLSFREAPVVLRALGKLGHRPDVVILDAQGQAHPRRAGLASHVGVLAGWPCIGCAKSRLIGQHEESRLRKGATADLLDKSQELIGRVVRTRRGVKPVFVSVGHLIELDQAVQIVLALAVRYRLPEPTRLAHLLAGRLRWEPPF